MMAETDIRYLLDSWEFDPEKTIRILDTRDGRKVMQVRLPLGLEQYEMDGRPDGKRMDGYETLLECVKARLLEYAELHGTTEGFVIDHELFVRLQNEAILIYYRYLLLFQLNDYPRVMRDTLFNLELAALVESHSDTPDDVVSIVQFRPYIIRMHAVAQSMLLVQQEKFVEAVDFLKKAIQDVENLEVQPSAVFQFERSRSLSYLNTTLEQIQDREQNPLDELETELRVAVESENYERAALLRDQIRNMQG